MPTVEERAHRNLCDFVRFQARLHAAELLDEPGIVAFRAPTDFPSFRLAIPTDGSLPAPQFAERAVDFLLEHGKTAAIFTRAGAEDDLAAVLAERGFVEYSRSPEMVCEARLEDRQPPRGVTVRLASTAEDVRAYADIAGHAFRHLAFPEELTRQSVDHPDVMLESNVVIALADLDGRPVAGACSVLFGSAPDAYVGWVSCLDDARGMGLGDVVTRRVTNESFDRGAGVVTLEASPFGESTYARMGYRELYRYATLIKL
jgi:hypothetical protein